MKSKNSQKSANRRTKEALPEWLESNPSLEERQIEIMNILAELHSDVLSLDPDIAVTEQESGEIIDGNQESGEKISEIQESGKIILGSQKSGEKIDGNQGSGERIREIQESGGSDEGKMENVEVEVVVDFLRRACFQVVSSSDRDILSKKLLDALIKNVILELKPLGEERSGSDELLWLKMRIGLLCFFLGIIILVSVLLLRDFGAGNSFPGSITPT
ncbi:uncharacterized protein LOC143853679 isoform X1 [Tasmannia lanceolata]|uniref:uncharacterized protein LOC143853679 isoform X1 n=1 Tax=Tasmannia lanceolata TaxID=3420 RepID=UPI004063293A